MILETLLSQLRVDCKSCFYILDKLVFKIEYVAKFSEFRYRIIIKYVYRTKMIIIIIVIIKEKIISERKAMKQLHKLNDKMLRLIVQRRTAQKRCKYNKN